MTLDELRRKRNNIAVKISDWKKVGKDITDLLKQKDEIKIKIKELKSSQTTNIGETTKNQIKKVKIEDTPIKKDKGNIKNQQIKTNPKITTKTWSKLELEKCERLIHRIVDENDWYDGYQLRSSEWMYIKNIGTKVLQDSVEFHYTIEYRTKSHHIEKLVTRYFNPDNVQQLNDYIERVEIWVMLNSGDMDDKNIMFGARFNKVQFNKNRMAERGWIIKK